MSLLPRHPVHLRVVTTGDPLTLWRCNTCKRTWPFPSDTEPDEDCPYCDDGSGAYPLTGWTRQDNFKPRKLSYGPANTTNVAQPTRQPVSEYEDRMLTQAKGTWT